MKHAWENWMLAIVLLPILGLHAKSQNYQWQEIKPTVLPEAVSHTPLVYDSVSNRLLFYGGSPGPGQVLGETWECKGGIWTNLNPSKPPGMGVIYDHGAAFDFQNEELIIFGGGTSTRILNDTWLLKGGEWSKPEIQVNPPNAVIPNLIGLTMAYHSASQRVIAFGGNKGHDNLSNETWEWNGTTRTWTFLDPTNKPQKRWASTMCYDPIRQVIVLYGGWDTVEGSLNDCWEWTGSDWVQVTETSTWPGRRSHVGLAYDVDNKRMLLFGGTDGSTNFNDLWERVGSGPWTPITTSGTSIPSVRRYPLFCYDPSIKSTVLFGGQPTVSGHSAALGDYWQLLGINNQAEIIWNTSELLHELDFRLSTGGPGKVVAKFGFSGFSWVIVNEFRGYLNLVIESARSNDYVQAYYWSLFAKKYFESLFTGPGKEPYKKRIEHLLLYVIVPDVFFHFDETENAIVLSTNISVDDPRYPVCLNETVSDSYFKLATSGLKAFLNNNVTWCSLLVQAIGIIGGFVDKRADVVTALMPVTANQRFLPRSGSALEAQGRLSSITEKEFSGIVFIDFIGKASFLNPITFRSPLSLCAQFYFSYFDIVPELLTVEELNSLNQGMGYIVIPKRSFNADELGTGRNTYDVTLSAYTLAGGARHDATGKLQIFK